MSDQYQGDIPCIFDVAKLGELIEMLKKRDYDEEVYFDFGWFAPTDLASYRGYYNELALGYDKAEVTVGSLIEKLEGAIGKVYEGYKGGDFVMTKDTRIWAANWGEAPGVGIIGIYDKGGFTYLQTALVD